MPTRCKQKNSCLCKDQAEPVELVFIGDLMLGNRVTLVAVQQWKKLHGLRITMQ